MCLIFVFRSFNQTTKPSKPLDDLVLSLEQSTSYKIVKYNQLHTEIPKYWHELNVIKLGDKVLNMYYRQQLYSLKTLHR